MFLGIWGSINSLYLKNGKAIYGAISLAFPRYNRLEAGKITKISRKRSWIQTHDCAPGCITYQVIYVPNSAARRAKSSSVNTEPDCCLFFFLFFFLFCSTGTDFCVNLFRIWKTRKSIGKNTVGTYLFFFFLTFIYKCVIYIVK